MEKQTKGYVTLREINPAAKWIKYLSYFFLIVSVFLLSLHFFSCNWFGSTFSCKSKIYPFCFLPRLSPFTYYPFYAFEEPAYGNFSGCLILVFSSLVIGIVMKICSHFLFKKRRWAWFLSVIIVSLSLIGVLFESIFTLFGNIDIIFINRAYSSIFYLVVFIIYARLLSLLFYNYNFFKKTVHIFSILVSLILFLILAWAAYDFYQDCYRGVKTFGLKCDFGKWIHGSNFPFRDMSTEELMDWNEKGGKCIDSDGGKDYYVAGRAELSWSPVHDVRFGNKLSIEDICIGSELREAICKDDVIPTVIEYNCPLGCRKGACIKNIE